MSRRPLGDNVNSATDNGVRSHAEEPSAAESLDRYFRIEYQVEPSAAPPVVSGYVYNMHPGLPADRMQLAIEALDASGKVVGTSSTSILGGVPAGNRGYFSAPVVPAASYRVQVLFFDWGKGGGQ